MTSEQLEQMRTDIKSNREAVAKLKKLIYDITDELSLDEDKMTKRVDSAVKSEYGAINGLINLLSAIANWPADQGNGSDVSENRKILEEKFQLDLLHLEDIRTFRGYHSFVTDELEIVDGVEPMYAEYTGYCQIFLEELGLESTKPTIDEAKWDKAEIKAIDRAKDDLVTRKAEIETHRKLIAEQIN